MASTDDTLTADELRAITGKAQAKSQAAALARLGLPFRFTGRAVLLERAVAKAHELLPQARPEPTELPPVQPEDRLNAGLRAWQADLHQFRADQETAARMAPELAAAIAAEQRQAGAVRRQAKNAERGRRRKATERRQTPAWADPAATLTVYEEAARRTRETGIKHQVDHEVPLRGKLVSGLHVHHNLRVITATANRKKSRSFTP